jgi:hypothetical protein
MPIIRICPYHSNLHKSPIRVRLDHPVAKAYADACSSTNPWPYDYGDDPSFFSAQYLGGPITWGVCRGDIRSRIAEGDVVIFVAFEDLESGTTYRLTAIATVEKKISENSIFLDPQYKRFQQYLNLLTRPTETGWKREEPCFAVAGHPTDWLWRMADRTNLKSKDFKGSSRREIRSNQLFGGKPYQFGANYIVFSMHPEKTYVVHAPPFIAHHEADHARETWHRDAFSAGVFDRTLKVAVEHGMPSRGLRLPKAYPHTPPATWDTLETEVAAWRSEFITFLKSAPKQSTGDSKEPSQARKGRGSGCG